VPSRFRFLSLVWFASGPLLSVLCLWFRACLRRSRLVPGLALVVSLSALVAFAAGAFFMLIRPFYVRATTSRSPYFGDFS
jgi:hypothetical protein